MKLENKNKNNCLLCSGEIVYKGEYLPVKCSYCGGEFTSNVTCSNGHYVCDSCHSLGGVELVLSYCIATTKANPIEMANDIMNTEGFCMHGPEHHFLTPAILITSYYNNISQDTETKKKKLLVAKKRAEDVKGGFCGFYGSCGAAVGCGIFLSVITSTTPLTKDTWGLVNEATGRVLIKLSKIGGPRCCKKGVFTAISETSKLIHEKLNIKLYDYENTDIECGYTKYNKECIGKECPYNRLAKA
ncbi:MAG: DUF5714 domain-containing protein [Clostridium sp.]